MNKKKWVTIVLTLSTSTILFIITFNYIINPYNVFSHTIYSGVTKDNLVNDEVTKFYSAKRANPKVLLIGTSRTEHINPKYMQKYTKDKVFNLGIKGSGISTQYNMIKYFIHNTEVKTIILGLDFFSFNPASTHNYQDISKTRYTNYFFDDYKDALFGFRTFRKSLNTFFDNIKNKQPRLNHNNGWDSYNNEYNRLKKNGDDWLKEKINASFPNFGINKLFFDNEEFKNEFSINEELSILDDIISLCKKSNIELKIFTSPVYYKVYEVIKERGYSNTYKYWKESLSSYGIVYDFNYKNSVTQNYKHYIDASHYQSKLGKLIFAKLYNDQIPELPNDFGVLLLPTEEKLKTK